jgi:hypothetical protein
LDATFIAGRILFFSLLAFPVLAKMVFRRQRVHDADVGAAFLQFILPLVGSAAGLLIVWITGASLGDAAQLAFGAAIIVLALTWWAADEMLNAVELARRPVRPGRPDRPPGVASPHPDRLLRGGEVTSSER